MSTRSRRKKWLPPGGISGTNLFPTPKKEAPKKTRGRAATKATTSSRKTSKATKAANERAMEMKRKLIEQRINLLAERNQLFQQQAQSPVATLAERYHVKTPPKKKRLAQSMTVEERMRWIQSFIDSPATPTRIDFYKSPPSFEIITSLPDSSPDTPPIVKQGETVLKLLDKFKEPPKMDIIQIDFDKSSTSDAIKTPIIVSCTSPQPSTSKCEEKNLEVAPVEYEPEKDLETFEEFLLQPSTSTSEEAVKKVAEEVAQVEKAEVSSAAAVAIEDDVEKADLSIPSLEMMTERLKELIQTSTKRASDDSLKRDSVDSDDWNKQEELFVTKRTPARKNNIMEVVDLSGLSDDSHDKSTLVVPDSPDDKEVEIVYDGLNEPAAKRRREKLLKEVKKEPGLEKEEKSDDVRSECPICLERLSGQEISATICGHIFCTSCIRQAVKTQRKCPKCRKHLTLRKLIPLYT